MLAVWGPSAEALPLTDAMLGLEGVPVERANEGRREGKRVGWCLEPSCSAPNADHSITLARRSFHSTMRLRTEMLSC